MAENNETVTPVTTPINITINDLIVVRSVIDAATRGGVLTANDLSVVGTVHDKIHGVVEDFLAKQKESEDGKAEEAPKTETGEVKK
tara:strand:- start:225 stop:482 length:258 start_codon:yes stop_codon:yes gene_type:complete